MSKLLFNEQPITIDRTLAKKIGLNEAIIIQQIHYWLEINKKKKNNFINGRYWTYNSIKDWHEQEFDFVSYDTVKRTLKRLEKLGILIVDMFNKMEGDKTKWYTIHYEILEEVCEKEMEKKEKETEIRRARAIEAFKNKEGEITPNDAKCPNGYDGVQNALMGGAKCPNGGCKMPQPIPEITTKTPTKTSTLVEVVDTATAVKHFEVNICQLKKSTKVKFEDICSKVDLNLIKEIINYGAETNAKSFAWFERVVSEKLKEGINDGESFKFSVKEFRLNNKRQKTYNKNKVIDNFNNYDQRKYTKEDYARIEEKILYK